MRRDPSGTRRQRTAEAPTTRRRERTVRLSDEAAARVAEGHPWVFADALRGREIHAAPGTTFDLIDGAGHFIARALYDPGGPIALRAFSVQPGVGFDASWIRAATARAGAWRRQLLQPGPASALRVLNGDSEGVPATNVDRYGDFLVVTAYSAAIEPHLEGLVDGLMAVWRARGIYLQKRYLPATPDRPRQAAQLVRGDVAPPEVIVSEGRARFSVDVTAPVGSGLFIDMRQGRATVAARAAGRRVLNSFSYTGAFTVVAALHGAAEIVSIDASAKAHARARRNCTLNALEGGGAALEFVTGDTLATVERARSRGRLFDLLIVDPPTFASSKQRSFAAFKDYADLVGTVLGVAAPGALLLAACNAAKLSWGEFQRAVGRGVRQAGRSAVLIERISQPEDYPTLPSFEEGRYLKAGLFLIG